MFLTLTYVAFGGALGAVARYLTGAAALRLVGAGFPWGTIIVNIAGSFLMGVCAVLLTQWSATRFAPLLMTGFLGGFTTFSAFSLDAVALYERGALGLAVVYVFGSVVASLVALLAGLWCARGILA